MIGRGILFIAGSVIVAGTVAPKLFESYMDAQPVIEEKSADIQPVVTTPRQTQTTIGTTTLKADQWGHYAAKIKVDGKQIEGMIDTGASLVSMDESTARRLGYVVKDSDYKYKSQTANGIKAIAVITLDRVDLGNISVRNVQAAVSKDGGLGTVLIGMSFLKKLKSFKSENGKLILTR